MPLIKDLKPGTVFVIRNQRLPEYSDVSYFKTQDGPINCVECISYQPKRLPSNTYCDILYSAKIKLKKEIYEK